MTFSKHKMKEPIHLKFSLLIAFNN